MTTEEKRVQRSVSMFGNSGVGKSALFSRFRSGDFPLSKYEPTIGVDFCYRNKEYSGLGLQIWDTGGQFEFFTSAYARVDGVIVVYDLTSWNSFLGAKWWLTHITTERKDSYRKMVLVGNKTDKEGRQVSTAEGVALAKEYGIPFYETSALSGTNVKEVFTWIAEEVRGMPEKVDRVAVANPHESGTTPVRFWCCPSRPKSQ